MMNSKAIAHLRGVHKTLILPLWGRAVFSKLYPEILYDQEAIGIMDSSDYDFGEVEKAFGEYGGLACIVRGRKIDHTIRRFTAEHPRATVVNIGAGFDTTFSRVDNGFIRWYDLDTSEVIALRKTILPEGDRNTCIAQSVFDYSWLNKIRFDAEDGILLVAGGVFYYFAEDKLRELFVTMAEKFPSGELYFDGQTQTALRISNRMVRRSGNQGARMCFHVDSPQMFTSWSPLINLHSVEPCFKNIPRDRRWKISTQAKMLVSDLLRMVSFYHLKFAR
jgi:O-methyltransferase involved in polyketide biosynthesis